jgi:hypothetical protein
MSNKNVAVFGIYATPATAEAAVDHLLARGFTNEAISVLLPDDESTRAFAHEKHTKAPEGTAAGVTTGGVIGGTLGLLAWRFRASVHSLRRVRSGARWPDSESAERSAASSERWSGWAFRSSRPSATRVR